MTEKEKMLHGDYYDSRDTELIKIYHKARKLLREYNQLDSELIQERERILKNFLNLKVPVFGLKRPFSVIMVKIFQLEKTPS